MTPIKRQEIVSAYVFTAPWLIGFLVFLAGPMLGAFVLALYEWNGIGAMKWRGLGNFSRAFGDFDFWQSLRVTSSFVFTALPARVVVALALALLVNRIRTNQNLFSTVIFIPVVIPGVALAILFARVLNPEVGLMNRFLELFGIVGPGWLFSPQWALPGLGLMFLWQSGGAMILYIIGLEAIPGELLEAAAIDGAGAWRRFLRITLPLLTPIILFNLIVGVIGNFQYFAPGVRDDPGRPQQGDPVLRVQRLPHRVPILRVRLRLGADRGAVLPDRADDLRAAAQLARLGVLPRCGVSAAADRLAADRMHG